MRWLGPRRGVTVAVFGGEARRARALAKGTLCAIALARSVSHAGGYAARPGFRVRIRLSSKKSSCSASHRT